MIRKPQTLADVVIGFTLIDSAGGNATGEAANITAIITSPTGAAVTGFTVPTITETAHAGNYIAIFGSSAANKAFTSLDNANPYHVSFDSSTAGIDPTGIIEVEIGTQLIDTDTEVDGLVTTVAAIKAKTDNLPASPAAVGSAMTLTSGERTDIDAALTTAHGSGSWGSASVTGPGSILTRFSVTDTQLQALDGVACWISTDAAGSNVVAGTLYTDSYGIVTFMLDAGPAYLWRQRSGINFDNPLPITVTP